MNIETRRLADLKPAAYNPRKKLVPGDPEYEKIARSIEEYVKEVGGTILPGYQLRYIYFIDPTYRKRLTVPEIPFSRIDELGAGMYKGECISQAERHAKSHFE